MTLVVGRFRAFLRQNGTALITVETDFGLEQTEIAAQTPGEIFAFLAGFHV